MNREIVLDKLLNEKKVNEVLVHEENEKDCFVLVLADLQPNTSLRISNLYMNLLSETKDYSFAFDLTTQFHFSEKELPKNVLRFKKQRV